MVDFPRDTFRKLTSADRDWFIGNHYSQGIHIYLNQNYPYKPFSNFKEVYKNLARIKSEAYEACESDVFPTIT